MDDECYANINGSTDSEHFAALYMTLLTSARGKSSWEEQYHVTHMRNAMRKAIGIVHELQLKYLADKAQPNSLNVATTDGLQLVTFRFRNHAVEQPPSLYYSTTAGTTLNRKFPDSAEGEENPVAYKKAHEHGKHVIVASEPSTYKQKEWTLIEKNHCLMVGTDGEVEVEEVVYPKEWNATFN